MTYEEFQKSLWEPKSKTGITSLEMVIDRLSVIVYDMHIENDILKNKIETLEYKINSITSDISRMKYHVEPDLGYME